jgi:hypothetical protein
MLELHGAPPLRSRASVVWPWMTFVLSAVVTALVVWWN